MRMMRVVEVVANHENRIMVFAILDFLVRVAGHFFFPISLNRWMGVMVSSLVNVWAWLLVDSRV